MDEKKTTDTQCGKRQMQEAASFALQRAETYRLFATLFDKEVRAAVAGDIASIALEKPDEDASKGEKLAHAGFAGMARELDGFDRDMDIDLAVDYARVFLNAGRNEGQAAIPYESFYTSEEHLLMQDSRDQIRALYREAGVMPQTGDMGTNPDDYLVYELEFTALLNERVADELERGKRERAREYAIEAKHFLRQHLANWSELFCRDMAETAHQRFYQYLAKAYRGFLMCEDEDTEALVAFLTVDGDAAETPMGPVLPAIDPLVQSDEDTEAA